MKLYANRRWLERKYITEGLTAKEIAKECNTTEVTIDRYLDHFNLKRNRRQWSSKRR